jgi:predicted small lipoprotein YifL
MRWLAALLLIMSAGCGQTGPLFLPGPAASQDAPVAAPQEQGAAADEEQDEENDR